MCTPTYRAMRVKGNQRLPGRQENIFVRIKVYTVVTAMIFKDVSLCFHPINAEHRQLLKSPVCSDWSALTCLGRHHPMHVSTSARLTADDCLVVTSQAYRRPDGSFKGVRLCHFSLNSLIWFLNSNQYISYLFMIKMACMGPLNKHQTMLWVYSICRIVTAGCRLAHWTHVGSDLKSATVFHLVLF